MFNTLICLSVLRSFQENRYDIFITICEWFHNGSVTSKYVNHKHDRFSKITLFSKVDFQTQQLIIV
jgi:hypothetical protein